MKIIQVYADYFRKRVADGKGTFVLQGGRRSGKTIAICQRLLLLCYNEKRFVNVATMTQEQGRLGVFADMKNIIQQEPMLSAYADICESPREIRFRHNKSRIFFNSYQNSETAKGIACDYLFINEANNFSLQQYIDLSANVRKGVYIDFNPNSQFWVDEFFSEVDILRTTWKDNPMLTPLQLDYFAKLKELGTAPNASAVNVRNYRVYYLGEYSELTGHIFTLDNIQVVDDVPRGTLRNFTIFCDPSALRGADWFACVLSATDESGKMYVLDTFSRNDGSREMMVRHILEWCRSWDVSHIYVETNGIIGIDFFEFAQNSGLPVEGWYSRGNKFERIVGNFQNVCENVVFVRNAELDGFVSQVYDFDTKCDHDDNIDAVVSSLMAHKFNF